MSKKTYTPQTTGHLAGFHHQLPEEGGFDYGRGLVGFSPLDGGPVFLEASGKKEHKAAEEAELQRILEAALEAVLRESK